MRSGRKSEAQTPSPKKDRIKGSKVNSKGSASSAKSAKSIELSDSIINTLENKRDEYNKKHPNGKVTLGALKAVFRRGAGAFSSSHRPNMTRSGWAFARVNKFLLKKGGTKVKAAYVQDDDLMEKGGEIVNYLIHWTNRGGLEGILNDNSFYEETSFTDSLKLPFDRDNNMSFGIRLKNVPRNLLVKQGVTELEKKHEYRTKKSLQLEKYFDGFIVRNNTNKDRLEKYLKNRANIYYNDKYFKEKVYVQKYELMEKGAILDSSCKKYISQNESILKTGYYLNLNEFSSMIDPYGQIPLNLNYTLVTYNSGNQDGLSLIDTINPINLQNQLADILNIPLNNAQVVVGLYIEMGKKLKSISQIEGDNILVIDRDKLVCKSGKDDDLMEKGGKITWDEYIKTQFDENENRYLPENYFEDFTIQEANKQDYPTLLKEEDGLEYRKWKYGGIGVFDDNKKVAFADNGSIQVSPLYQKRGIGIELVSLLKELNPSHRFGNMTPQGWNLMRSYYNKKVANRYDEGGDLGQEITCVNCGWSWNTNQSDAFDKYICHKCGFDNRTFYDSDPIGEYHLGGDMSMHLAPNGKESNLTHEQWHLVRTPEFKAWFGDWENDPENSSKVVDENGEPLVVFHGGGDFNYFDALKIGKTDKGWYGYGFYFSPSQEISDLYGNSKPYFINIKKIFNCNKENPFYGATKEVTEYYINEGYEGSSKTFDVNKKYHEYCVFFKFPNNIKLADGSNTTFDANNPDIRYEEGGLLKKAPSILKIADKHDVDLETIQNALKDGIKKEMEHTKNRNVARTIASHHLYESPKYYEKLKIMEKELNLDEHYEDIKKIYAIGGVVDPVLSFSTPTGEPSKLTYLQQILVRTSAFKNFFGDWEYAGKRFVESGRQEYEYLYRNVSKVIDKITLEPKVVYHGTRVDSEFYVFDVSQQSGDGRPYGYFAHNKEYSENFTTSSQRSMANAQPFLYKCFVNIRNPFYAMTSEYYNIQEDAQYWKNEISKTIALDKYTNELDSNKLDKIKEVVESQIGKYIDDTFGMSEYSFWLLMARDKNKLFKYFLNNYRYDGIFYAEEFGGNYDVDNPSEFTEAVTIFEPSQVKLADGRNLNFDPMNVDIRYEKGGDTDNVEKTQKTSNIMGKRENLRNLLLGDKYAEGGEVVANKLKDGNDGKKGGYFEGRSHDDGGIKAYNKDTGQMIEVEGEEVIITKGAVKDPQKREFEGEMLTNREILSRINQSGGGVSFAEGGEMKSSSCGCSGKKYKYGGEMMDDYSIVKIMNRPFEIINDNFADARAFADMLVEKLK
jgi:GNAT superfamily N-acetyltransferase